MIPALPRVYLLAAILVCAALVIALSGKAQGSPTARPKPSNTVWVVFFSSRDCPRCEGVRILLQELKKKYPVKVKGYDIEKAAHYRLFHRLESIHPQERFSVPLIMVADAIFKGEKEISQNLEKTVRKLATSGGSSMPYLGEANETGKSVAAHDARGGDPPCPECGRKGRPPSIEEEWRNIRRFFEKWFR